MVCVPHSVFTKYFEIGGHALNVIHAGRSTLPGVPPDFSLGKCLVFLHGAGSNGSIWHRQIRHFSKRQSPLAFDFPGHGRSSGTEGLPTIAAYAEVTLQLLDRLAVRRAVVVGTSMGGLVAIDIALRDPERVEALVLLSCAARVKLPPKLIETWHQVTAGRIPQPFTPYGYGDGMPIEVLREGWENQAHTDPRVRHSDLLAVDGADYRSRLAEIRMPALVVSGTKDPLAPPAICTALAAGITCARQVEIEGAGHFLYREVPEALHAAIDSFLDSL